MLSAKLSRFSRPDSGLLVALPAAIAIIPLIVPAFPPLTDVPGHLGRYAVQIGLADDPVLAGWFSFDWRLIGNLGVDLPVQWLGPLMGVEAAVKLIVIAIVVLSVIGMIALQRAASGRVGPAACFALPLIYGFPFQFGFINYCLSMAFALCAAAYWIRLGQANRIGYRAALFVPLSLMIWLTHIGGWGALGLIAFAGDVERLRGAGRGTVRAWAEAGLQVTVLALPALVTVVVRMDGAAGDTLDWFNWLTKFQWFAMALSDQWQVFDLWSVCIIGFVLAAGLALPLFRFNRTLGLATVLMLAAFIITPRVLIGSAYADMRLAPWILALGLLGMELKPDKPLWVARCLMAAGLAFFLVRTGATTVSFLGYDQVMRGELAALDHVPRHARIVALVGRECNATWQLERRAHLPSLAIVRRHAFSNDQFDMPGAQLIGVHYPAGAPFAADPSQMVTNDSCARPDWIPYTKAVALIPHAAFDYLWVIGAPRENRADLRGFTPLWQHGRSALYRVEH